MDTVDRKTRSRMMSRIRSRGNRTTELRARMILVRAGVRGWTISGKWLPGKPDLSFPSKRLAVFLDGCFWHSCPKCGHLPRTNRAYWSRKLRRNSEHDRHANSKLRAIGWRPLRVWEHELRDPARFRSKMAAGLRMPRLRET